MTLADERVRGGAAGVRAAGAREAAAGPGAAGLGEGPLRHAIGRAVHAVLQAVDLDSGDGVDELSASQALAEGVADAAADIAAAARAALASDVVQRAAARPHWRETYVGTVVDGTLVEGYVDLLYRDDDGLVLVDYKTDAAMGAEALIAYETQLAVYARAITDATAEPVTRSVLLFLRPGNAVEHDAPAQQLS